MNKCKLEGFLHNVFSVFVVSHNTLRKVKNPPPVAIEELAKSNRMAAHRGGQQPCVIVLPSLQVDSPLIALKGRSTECLN